MNDTIKPNAYLMRGALPSVERSRDEYTGSVFGSAALAYITIIHATDAMDMMQERLPELYDDRQVRKYINRMTGTKASMGEIRKLTLAIGSYWLTIATRRGWQTLAMQPTKKCSLIQKSYASPWQML